MIEQDKYARDRTSQQRQRVRLAPEFIVAIRRATARHFGPDARVRLFGSRIDPSRRGGDIDLYIEPTEDLDDLLGRTLRMNAELQMELGEQRIDILTRRRDRPSRPIDDEALRTGVLL
ncbi:nucleotidyltransferase domain-containing protein [Thiohalocapsa marina]|uniref:Nucleotidyltransferase domain-containing protein n=1 Tax=Thiohalocapsa marina TaxID=424902 RepID=A0A5M8FMR5_9GAMM|nr:nucleotidyltransferase domain-containing protein [Thiohalocapsa marina]KAA6186019.1 nucleotidyltransferase domain-containing protein [Thiohalocapsa marina]